MYSMPYACLHRVYPLKCHCTYFIQFRFTLSIQPNLKRSAGVDVLMLFQASTVNQEEEKKCSILLEHVLVGPHL